MPASLILYLIVQSLPDLFVLANQIAGSKEMVFLGSLVRTFASVHVNIQVILNFLVSRFLALSHVSIPFVFRSITYVHHHIIMNDTRKWLHSILTSLVYFYSLSPAVWQSFVTIRSCNHLIRIISTYVDNTKKSEIS